MSRSRLFFCMCQVGLIALVAQTASASLKIDFNSTTQDQGPHNQSGFQAYDAGHEIAVDFVTKSYSAFGTTVTVTPAWPNTTDNRVQQMIDRDNQDAAGNVLGSHDETWNNVNGDINLATDWIGVDTRGGSGGNGNWDGTTGTPTYITLTLGDLPEGQYAWTSYHHDTEHVHGFFSAEISVDGGGTFEQLADGYMSNGNTSGNPKPDTPPYLGFFDDFSEGTYTTKFLANGTDDVVMRFAPYANTGTHRQLWGVNGFVLQDVPEPSSFAIAAIALLGFVGVVGRKR